MTRRAALISLSLVAAALAGACNPRVHHDPPPPPAVLNWPAALGSAQRAADEGRYADAERELSVFAQLHEGSMESLESTYWRALFRLDPRNKVAMPRDAVALVDSLLLSRGEQPRRSESVVLRRTALLVDSLRRVIATPRPPVVLRDTTRLLAQAREFEEQRKVLRDSLDRTLAELDRIRRALAAPTP